MQKKSVLTPPPNVDCVPLRYSLVSLFVSILEHWTLANPKLDSRLQHKVFLVAYLLFYKVHDLQSSSFRDIETGGREGER